MRKSDAYFVLRDGAAGVFLAANTFPKSRETRAPLVEELYRFRDRLPENCVIWPMRHSRIRKVIRPWFALAVKPNSNMSLRKKTERRLAGQHFMLMANGLMGKITFNSVGFLSTKGRESGPFLLHIIFSSHLYTKAINDIVVIVSTFLLLNRISHPPGVTKNDVLMASKWMV